jgi:hypothetical protein
VIDGMVRSFIVSQWFSMYKQSAIVVAKTKMEETQIVIQFVCRLGCVKQCRVLVLVVRLVVQW